MTGSALAFVSRLVSGASVQWLCEPDAPVQRVFFGNHSSHLDFVVIWASLPPRLRAVSRPVAGRDYWEAGSFRRYVAAHVFRAVLIDRHGAHTDDPVAAARAATEFMAREMGTRHSLIVFPEGTRSVTGQIGPFKSGLFHLSRRRPDVEFVPVFLANLNRILPKGETLPVPMLSRVTFGRPLAIDPAESKDSFLAKARTALVELQRTS